MLDPTRHEAALRTGLLARAAAAVQADLATRSEIGAQLFELLRTTRAASLWRLAGEHLRGLRLETAAWCEQALADGLPMWRLQPLSDDPAVARLLLAELDHPLPARRTAGLRALAPQVHDPQVRAAVLARLDDPHAHVRSTALEVLRAVATAPEVRDALLELCTPATLPGCVDRALRRCLRAAVRDPKVQAAMLDELRGRRAHVAAAALADATPSEALADALLAVLATTPHISQLAPAFTPIAHLERVTAAFLARADDDRSFDLQAALRVIGRGVTAAARDRLLRALGHETHWIRWTALEQLEHRLADPACRAAALRCLADPDDSVRMIALRRTLAAIADDPEVRAAARERLADPSEAVRIAAAGLLARTGPDLAAWAVLAPFVREARGRIYTKQWQAIDGATQLGALVGLAEVRDAIAPGLGAWRADQRAAVARCLADAPPCEAIADLLAARVEQDLPLVADAAFVTLRRWTGAP